MARFLSTHFGGTLRNNYVKSYLLREILREIIFVLTTNVNHSFFIFALNPLAPNFLLGYFAHIVRHESDGKIAKEFTIVGKVMSRGDVFMDVAVGDLLVPNRELKHARF